MGNNSKMPLSKWLPLIGLTCSAFVFNTSEFIPIGLLTDIAADFGLTEAKAGMLISVYAWAVMLLSLPLMVLATRVDLRKLMLGLMGLMAAFQFMSFASTSFGMLMASRLGVACTHAVFWSIVSPMAVRIAPPEHRQLALSMIVTGTSIAIILGLPIGRAIGLQIGWRMTFMSIGVCTALTFLYLWALLPRVQGSGKFTFGQLPGLLSHKALTGIFIFAFATATSYYVAYSYIEPFFKQVAHMANGTITIALMIYGAAGMLGSIAFSKLYPLNRYRFVSVTVAALALCLAMLLPAAANLAATVALCVVWGMAVTAYNVAMQSEIINIAPPEGTSVAMSIFSGIFNLGIGLGAFAGGCVCSHLSIKWIGVAGCVVAVAALAYWLLRLSGLLRAAYARRG